MVNSKILIVLGAPIRMIFQNSVTFINMALGLDNTEKNVQYMLYTIQVQVYHSILMLVLV